MRRHLQIIGIALNDCNLPTVPLYQRSVIRATESFQMSPLVCIENDFESKSLGGLGQPEGTAVRSLDDSAFSHHFYRILGRYSQQAGAMAQRFVNQQIKLIQRKKWSNRVMNQHDIFCAGTTGQQAVPNRVLAFFPSGDNPGNLVNDIALNHLFTAIRQLGFRSNDMNRRHSRVLSKALESRRQQGTVSQCQVLLFETGAKTMSDTGGWNKNMDLHG